MMKKAKNNKGFTMVEMLACIIVLLLISGICSTGMSLAAKSYTASVFESNSQMLQSTLDMYLVDMLRHTSEVDYSESLDVEGYSDVNYFTNASYGIQKGHLAVGTDETLDSFGKVLAYTSSDDSVGTMVVGTNVYAENLYITNFVIKYNKENGCFSGSYLIKCTSSDDVEKECTFTCRRIMSN